MKALIGTIMVLVAICLVFWGVFWVILGTNAITEIKNHGLKHTVEQLWNGPTPGNQ